jgi:diguanylate cyclase (GGDEF)-like protein
VNDVVDRPGRPLLAAISHAGLCERHGNLWSPVADTERFGPNVEVLLVPRSDPDGIWIGTEDRGAFFQKGKAPPESFGTNEGLPHSTVRALYEDREGILWIGGEGGLAKRAPSAFLLWDAADGLLAGAAFFGMAEGKDGTIWAASGSGLWKLDRSEHWSRIPLEEGGAPVDVNDVAIDAAGGVWAGTTRGLARLDASGKLKLLGIPSGATPTVLNLAALPGGRIVFGTRRSGLGILLPGGEVRVAGPPVGRSIEALTVLADGRLLAGGYGWGIAEIDPERPEKPRLLHSPESLPSPNVNHLFEDRGRRLWISTEKGALGIGPDGSRLLIDRKSGLPDDFVYWVGQEAGGALWLGTNRGAVRRLPSGEIEIYGARDGLPVDECNDDGFFLTRDGRVLLASVGIARFVGRPKPIAIPLPPVQIERISIGGRSVPVVDRIELPPRPGQLRIEIACLSFVDESRNRFRYRLGGLSDEWIESDPGRNEAVFGGLGTGEYLFEAIGESSDRRVSERPTRLVIVVRPLWWQSTRIRVIALLVAVAAIFLAIRLRLARQLRRSRELERLVEERTEELRAANEKLARMAITDDLTGIENRRRILERLGEALAWARRHEAPLSILLADLDHFKAVNDTLGHAVGDEVLRTTARALTESIREVDGVGRYGGEEFLILFPGEGPEGALVSAQRLRERVGAAIAADERLKPLRNIPTLSGGIATLDAEVVEAAELVQRADEALYVAKASGRNRIVTWPVGAKDAPE